MFCLRMKSGLTVSYYLGRFGGIPDSSMSDGLVNRTYQLFPRVDQNSQSVSIFDAAARALLREEG